MDLKVIMLSEISQNKQEHIYLHLYKILEIANEYRKKVRLERKRSQFNHSVMSDSVTPWNAAHSLLKLMSIETVMPSNQLILCHRLLFSPSIFPSIRLSCNKSALRIRWPNYWSFCFNISPSSEPSGLISFRMDWLDINSIYISIYLNPNLPIIPPLFSPWCPICSLQTGFCMVILGFSPFLSACLMNSQHLAPNLRSLKLRLIESCITVIGLPLWLSW